MSQQPKKIFLGPVKLGQKVHMEALLNEGQLYMNPVKYFTEYEENQVRGDPNEGNAASLQVSRIKFRLKLAEGKTLEFSKQMGWDGHLNIRFHETLGYPMYCMYLILPDNDSITVDERVKTFGDYAVFVRDPSEFLRRVVDAVKKQGLKFESKMVQYGDLQKHHGDTGVFMKTNDYAYQNELRFIIYGQFAPYKLLIGAINDIAVLMTTEEFLSGAPNLRQFKRS